MRRNTQGCPELSDDLWYLILAKQDLFTLLTSCQPVCRSWTSIARELTSTRFYLECNLEPDKPPAKANELFESIETTIMRRSQNLQDITLVLGSVSVAAAAQRLSNAISHCQKLQKLVFNVSPSSGSINLEGLPKTLTDLSIVQHGDSCCQPQLSFGNETSINSLAVSVCPFGLEQMDQIAKLTNLGELVLWNVGPSQNLLPIHTLTNLKLLYLEQLDEFNESLQGYMLLLPQLEKVGFRAVNGLANDLSLETLKKHPCLESVRIDVNFCNQQSLWAVLSTELVWNFKAEDFHDWAVREDPEIVWSRVMTESLTLPMLIHPVLDWAEILLAPNLLSLSIHADIGISFQNLSALTEDVIASRDLKISLSVWNPDESFDSKSEDIMYLESVGIRGLSKRGSWHMSNTRIVNA